MVPLPLAREFSEGRCRLALLNTQCGITPSCDLPPDVLGPPACFIKIEVRETPKRDYALLPVAASAIAEGPGLHARARHAEFQPLFVCITMFFLRLVRLDGLNKARSKLALRHLWSPWAIAGLPGPSSSHTCRPFPRYHLGTSTT